MTTIKLHIPDELAKKVYLATENAEAFIIDMLRSKFKEDKPLPLREQYGMAAQENVALMADFSHIDLEGWDDEY